MAENNLRSKHLRNNASIRDTEDLILQSTHYNAASHSILEAQLPLSWITSISTEYFCKTACVYCQASKKEHTLTTFEVWLA